MSYDSSASENNKSYSIQFIITEEQYRVLTRIADTLYKNNVIKVNSINAVVKACAFTQVNLYLQMEAREKAYKQRELQLEKDRIELEKRGIIKYQNYVPNVPVGDLTALQTTDS